MYGVRNKTQTLNMKYCPQCGVQNPAESKFCKSCGYNFLPTVENIKQTQPDSSKVLNPEKAAKTTRKQIKISKKIIRISLIIFIFLLLGASALIFKDQIAGVFYKADTGNTDTLSYVATQTTIPEQAIEPVAQTKTNENLKEETVQDADKQTSTTNRQEAVTAPQKFIKTKQAENLPEFNGLNDYLNYLGNPQNSYNEKATVQRKMIRENFTGKNFMVTVQTAGGVKTDQITINDLADEIRLNNSKIVIRTLKINKSNNLVTELVISFK